MAFFGLQSLSFYAMLTWLPGVLESDAGVSPVRAGVLLAVGAVLGAPLSLVVPPLAARSQGQGGWVLAASAPTAAALVGLLVAPAAAPALWAVLYGLGTGAAFPLAMTLVLLRSRDVAQTGRLSAAAQSVGYLVAATGPLAVGVLHDVTDEWTRRPGAAPGGAGRPAGRRAGRRPPAPGPRRRLTRFLHRKPGGAAAKGPRPGRR